MKKQNTNFKKMLRDRTPRIVDMALRWCKAKECWLDHVYNHFINIYADKKMRYEATRIMLGISGKYRNFDFDKTIDWDDLDKEQTEVWKSISEWVKWFSENHANLEDTYKAYKNDYSYEELIDFMAERIDGEKKLAKKLVKFIIDNV